MRAPRGRGRPLVGLDVLSVAIAGAPIAADSNIDKRMDWRFLDLRRPEQNLVFRVQSTFEHALRTYRVDNDFIELHTPKLMAGASESNAELFEVKYLEGTAFLARSPQFFNRMAQPAGFGKVFEVGPACRADPSFTSRHAKEFTSVDAEVSWIDSHEDVMNLHENLLAAGLTAIKAKHGDEIKALPDVEVTVPTTPFPRIPFAEAKRIVAERGYEVLRADDNPSTTKSYDLIVNGAEISTGAQREYRIEVFEQQARDRGRDPRELGFYLDFFC